MARYHHPGGICLMDALTRNKDFEQGLEQLSMNEENRYDPVVQQMATAVLHEVEEARKRRARYPYYFLGGILIGLVLVGIIFAVVFTLPVSKRHHY